MKDPTIVVEPVMYKVGYYMHYNVHRYKPRTLCHKNQPGLPDFSLVNIRRPVVKAMCTMLHLTYQLPYSRKYWR